MALWTSSNVVWSQRLLWWRLLVCLLLRGHRRVVVALRTHLCLLGRVMDVLLHRNGRRVRQGRR